MNLQEMSIEALEERKVQIAEEINNPDADLDALEAEVRSIKAELETRKAVEAEKVEVRNNIANELVGEKSEIKLPKENEKMEERVITIDSQEYRNIWLKNLKGESLEEVEKRAYTSSNGAVPTLVADKFFEKAKKVAPMLDEITLFRVLGNLKVGVEKTRAAVAAGVEGTAATVAADELVFVNLGSNEFKKVIAISENALKMSVDAFEDYIVDTLTGDIVRGVDAYIISQIAGKTYSATDKVTAATPSYADVLKLISLLPAGYDSNAKFLMHKKTFYGVIASITTQAGQPIFVTDPQTGINKIMGYPVILDDYVAADTVYFGDYKQVVGNIQNGIAVESDRSSGFLSASVNYRGIANFDAKIANGEAICQLVKAGS